MDSPSSTEGKPSCCCQGEASAPAALRSSSTPCCRGVSADAGGRHRWVLGMLDTAVGSVPQVSTCLRAADRFGAIKAHWAIGRMRYTVDPGLYAVGSPGADSPVFVSANYKLSFDRLRSELRGIDGWILVLDTRGINVWCAAGKGTFGTEELVQRIETTNLVDLVAHHTLIVPQLGAPGVAAHEVCQRCGFRVLFGPVRARDIPEYLRNGMKATPSMRRVEFPLRDRLAVVPVEIVLSARWGFLVAAILFLLSGVSHRGFSLTTMRAEGIPHAILILGALLGGTVLTPALLPWLPGRSLAVKGFWIGLAVLLGFAAWPAGRDACFHPAASLLGWVCLVSAMSSFLAMNFTGATTYTSLSGVRREMRFAVPLQLGAALAGLVLLVVGRFIH